MADSGDSVRARLREAALALFHEAGYERTTAAEIAARVGVTERTFFRHYKDKREVLFDDEAVLRDALTGSIARAPETWAPLDVLFAAFRSVVPLLEGNRPFSEPWHAIVSRTPALRERELAKREALVAALAASLRARGVEGRRAALAAQIGMAAFVGATVAWLEHPEPGLGEQLEGARRDLGALARDLAR